MSVANKIVLNIIIVGFVGVCVRSPEAVLP